MTSEIQPAYSKQRIRYAVLSIFIAQGLCFASWASRLPDIKKDFNSVDCVGDQRYVFNIKGNDYRLVAIIKFKIKMTNTKITKGLKEAKYKTIIVTIIL